MCPALHARSVAHADALRCPAAAAAARAPPACMHSRQPRSASLDGPQRACRAPHPPAYPCLNTLQPTHPPTLILDCARRHAGLHGPRGAEVPRQGATRGEQGRALPAGARRGAPAGPIHHAGWLTGPRRQPTPGARIQRTPYSTACSHCMRAVHLQPLSPAAAPASTPIPLLAVTSRITPASPPPPPCCCSTHAAWTHGRWACSHTRSWWGFRRLQPTAPPPASSAS